MKLILKALKWIAIVIVLLLIVSFFLPSHCHVERSKVMKADAPTIYNMVYDFHQWKFWSPWYKKDTAAKIEYINGGMGKGSGYTWSSNNKEVGKGSMTMPDVMQDKSVDLLLNFDGMGTNKIKFTFEKVGEGTKVTWNMDSENSDMPLLWRPISKYFCLFMDKMIGPDFEQGLKQMDEVSASRNVHIEPKVTSVEAVDVPEMHLMKAEGECDMKDIGANLGKLYGKIGAVMAKNKCQMAGAPSAMYPGFTPGDTHTKLVAVMPYTGECSKCEAGVKCDVVKATKALKAVYFGHYEDTKIAYDKMVEWMKENKKQPAGEPWEEYVTDPTTASDYSKVQTNIYWPIK